MMYGRLHSEKFDVDIGFDFSVLGGYMCKIGLRQKN